MPTEDYVEEQKRKRAQLSKEQKRVLADVATEAAFADTEQRRKEREEKTARLRALRLAQETQAQQKA
jgi:peptide methionine sulfoxide reductase MsrB